MWIKVTKLFNLDPFLNVSSSIWLNPKLRINKAPIWWKDWQKKGIVTLGDLYHNNTLKSFDELERQYGIPKSHFYRYLQLRHMLIGVFGQISSAPKTAELLDDILRYYSLGCSMYYSMLTQTAGDEALLALKHTWERDLNLTLEDEVWLKICKNVVKGCKSASNAV